LIDDGEEAALLGAEAFVADPARARDIAFAINIEARGTSGTPFLFETTRERRWLVPIVAEALPHPVTTSLFATIYEMLPNDTDLTVFKRAGIAGINFAYLGDATHYHTPLDSFASVDEGSVQRRGDQVLAMVRAFGNAPLEPRGPANAVWFDVLAAFVVWWPAAWTPWMVAVAFALIGAAIALGVRRREIALTGVLLGVAAFAGAVVAAFALGQAVGWIAGWRAPGALFPPNVWPRIAAAWCGGIAAALAAAALARRRASFDSIFAGIALAWNVVALVLAVALPGTAYVAVVPGAILALLAVLRFAARAPEEVVCIAALVATAVVFVPFALIMHEALGPGSVGVVAVLLALVSLSFAPMLDALVRRLVPALVAATVVLGLVGTLVPNTSPSHPRQLSLAHVTDATGAARWQVDAAPPALRAVAPFEPQYDPVVSGARRRRRIRAARRAPAAHGDRDQGAARRPARDHDRHRVAAPGAAAAHRVAQRGRERGRHRGAADQRRRAAAPHVALPLRPRARLAPRRGVGLVGAHRDRHPRRAAGGGQRERPFVRPAGERRRADPGARRLRRRPGPRR